MAKRPKTDYVKRFIKDECANYDNHYRACVWGWSCRVLDGKRCAYLERAVLCSPNYKYKLPHYDYQKLSAQYTESIGTKSEAVKQRLCDCANPLNHRQRHCDSCAQKRRDTSNRKYNQKRVG